MNNKIKQLICMGLLCTSMLATSFATTENINEENNNTATLYEGSVRVNTLSFNNQQVMEPVLLYKGSYYMPMTPKIQENLGIKSGLSSEGLLTYELGVPQVSGQPEVLVGMGVTEERVNVLEYQKETLVDDVHIKSDAFHPVIIYNNTFYIPLNKLILEEGLETDVYFSKDRVLTLIRNMDKMPRGTVIDYPSTDQQDYIQRIEDELMVFKETLLETGERYEVEDQVQYLLETDEAEGFYVTYPTGDWQVVRYTDGENGHIVFFDSVNGYTYVGEYKEGTYEGIGRLRDLNGHITAIKPFNEEPLAYTERPLAYDDYMPVLGVLVSFEDEAIIGSDASWYEKFFGEDENSLSAYYREVTDGRLSIIPALEQNREINDGLIRVKLDQAHPNSGDAIGEATDLLMPILDQLKDQVEVSIYDKNDNGVIDRSELTVVVVLAGYESSIYTPSDYPQFRSHHLFSDISLAEFGETGMLNVIYMSELSYFSNKTELATTAVLSHEFGHQIGLPDLYDIDESSKGLGPFSLMAEGTNNYGRGQRPGQVIAPMDPWSRIQIGGITPEVVTVSGEYELRSAETDDYNVIRINTSNPNEYFLLENREIKGRDASLKEDVKQSGGILIYHIDEDVINERYFENKVNSDENLKGVDIEEASERSEGSFLDNDSYQDRYAPFFSARGTALFGGGVRPFTRLNDGSQSGVSVKVLTDGSISKVMITIQ